MNIWPYVCLVLQVILFIFGMYWMIVGLWGFRRVKDSLILPAPQKRFIILAPAHNEEKVIGNLVKSLKDIDYPSELYDILVIADNCTDKTAEIAKRLGAHALNHKSLPGELKGKPYAIKYALDYLGDTLYENYDAIVIFDADNVVTSNYLLEMNRHLLKGEKLIQCYLDSKNPKDNFLTLSYATTYYFMNRSWQLGKSRLGLGNAIGGTGFCVEANLMKKVGWTARSLTEDLEFTMQCLQRGVKTTWCHNARVYDEKPTSFKVSMVQRLRWARGHWDIFFKYYPRLMWRAITKLDKSALDGAIYLSTQAAITLGVALQILYTVAFFVPSLHIIIIINPWVWILFFLYTSLYIAYSVIVDSNIKVNKIKAIISMLLFNLTYLIVIIYALFTVKNKVWVRTEHSKAISMSDLDHSDTDFIKEESTLKL